MRYVLKDKNVGCHNCGDSVINAFVRAHPTVRLILESFIPHSTLGHVVRQGNNVL